MGYRRYIGMLMNEPWILSLIVLALLVAKAGVQLWLEVVNRKHVLAHANEVPEAFKETVDPATYAKSIQYTLAKIRLHQVEGVYEAVILGILLFSGLLPWGFEVIKGSLGNSAWVGAVYLFAAGLALALPGLPFNWYEHFRLEERFGFSTITPRIWWMDRLKGLLLSLAIGYPLMVLVLKLVDWTGEWWWLWGWGAILGFQLIMLVLAPVVIMPLFNKFNPLPEGSLRERLMQLAQRTGFHARSIQVMDGSKRSRHSNAFFTGFGRFRKIVLFDTLIEHLTEPELESVLGPRNRALQEEAHSEDAVVVGGELAGRFLRDRLAVKPALVLPGVRVSNREHRSGPVVIRAAERVVHVLVLTAGAFLVTPLRIPSRRLRGTGDATRPLVDWRFAEVK